MRRHLTLAVALVLLLAACGDGGASTTTNDPPPTTTVGGSLTTLPVSTVETVTFTTGDGLVLEGLHYSGGQTWVVLGHMFPADMDAWDGLARVLQNHGYSVLAYNNRGYGNSEGEQQPFELAADGAAAVAFARDEGARRVVYGGASMNGLTALHLAANDDLAAVFALSAVLAMPGLDDAASYTADIAVPVLLMAANDDGTAVADAQSIFDRLGGSGATTDLRTSSSGGHGTDMLDPPRIQAIVDWLTEVLG